MAKCDHTIDLRIEGLKEFEEVVDLAKSWREHARLWRIVAAVGWAFALGLAVAMVAG